MLIDPVIRNEIITELEFPLDPEEVEPGWLAGYNQALEWVLNITEEPDNDAN